MKKYILALSAVILIQGFAFPQQPDKYRSGPAKSIKSKVTVQNAWIRPATKGSNSAMYFEIQNNEEKPDTVTGVKSKLADIVELHESYKMQNDKMGMRPIKFIAIQPKSKTELKPGGLHVMLLDLVKDFKKGDLFEAIILLKHAGKIKVNAMVQDMPSMQGM
jgi:periplasmic copper chaperone A